jgi:hypothetical protein
LSSKRAFQEKSSAIKKSFSGKKLCSQKKLLMKVFGHQEKFFFYKNMSSTFIGR